MCTATRSPKSILKKKLQSESTPVLPASYASLTGQSLGGTIGATELEPANEQPAISSSSQDSHYRSLLPSIRRIKAGSRTVSSYLTKFIKSRRIEDPQHSLPKNSISSPHVPCRRRAISEHRQGHRHGDFDFERPRFPRRDRQVYQ